MRFTLRDLYAAELEKLTQEGNLETIGRFKGDRYADRGRQRSKR